MSSTGIIRNLEDFGLFFEMGLVDLVASTSHANVTVLLFRYLGILALLSVITQRLTNNRHVITAALID